MTRYTFKTYIAHEQEHYLYSKQTLDEAVAFSATVPFPESLMSLLYMDLDPIDAIIQQLNDEFWKLAATKEEQHHQNALALLDDLASRHIYFQQFRLDRGRAAPGVFVPSAGEASADAGSDPGADPTCFGHGSGV